MRPFETLAGVGQVRRLGRLALRALGDYDIKVARLARLAHGDNTTFRIEAADGARYTLRIHRATSKTAAMIRSELLWLAALQHEPDLATPAPVPTRAGELLTIASIPEVPEPRVCVLLRWVDGRFVDDGLTPTHLARVGAFMARLQISGARFRPPGEFVRGRLDNLYGKPRGVSEALARERLDNPEDEATAIRLVEQACSPEDARLVALLIRRIRTAQRAIGQGHDSFGLIHGDLHQENYLFHRGQVRAIDFDDCGYGHYLYDLAVTVFNVRMRADAPLLRAGLLAGYRSVRPLPAEHERHLDTFMDLRELQMLIWAIEMRDHPAFRATWRAEVHETMRYFRDVVEPEAAAGPDHPID